MNVPVEVKMCEACGANFLRRAIVATADRQKLCRSCIVDLRSGNEPVTVDWKNRGRHLDNWSTA